MSEIILGNIAVHANVGARDSERSHKQPVELNVRVEYRSGRAIRADKLEHALDYGKLLEVVRRAGEEKKFVLLESLADFVASRVLRHFPKARRVSVEASKPRVNVRRRARIAVRVERKR